MITFPQGSILLQAGAVLVHMAQMGTAAEFQLGKDGESKQRMKKHVKHQGHSLYSLFLNHISK